MRIIHHENDLPEFRFKHIQIPKLRAITIRFTRKCRLLFKRPLKECVKMGIMRDTTQRCILDMNAPPHLGKFALKISTKNAFTYADGLK